MTEATEGAPAFSASAAERLLAAACKLTGLDGSGACLLRLGENALFHLPAQAVVVRIARTMSYWPDATKEVLVSRWLSSLDFPAGRVHEIVQPVEVSGHPVTFWQFIDGRNGGRSDIAALGALLRRLHRVRRPTHFDLPEEDVLGRVRGRIERSPVSQADKDFLLGRFDELTEAVATLRYPHPVGPVHGDAHVENLIVRNGKPVLIDFERFAWGHPEWDLSLTATEYKTAGWWTDAEYASFVEAYGYDVTSWTDGFPVLRSVNELKMITWLMQNIGESAEIARDYETRMRTIRGEVTLPWVPF